MTFPEAVAVVTAYAVPQLSVRSNGRLSEALRICVSFTELSDVEPAITNQQLEVIEAWVARTPGDARRLTQ